MEEGIAAAGVQVEGTFNVKRFFETLAMILSRKENLSITVTVHEEGEQQPQKAAVRRKRTSSGNSIESSDKRLCRKGLQADKAAVDMAGEERAVRFWQGTGTTLL